MGWGLVGTFSVQKKMSQKVPVSEGFFFLFVVFFVVFLFFFFFFVVVFFPLLYFAVLSLVIKSKQSLEAQPYPEKTP